MRDKVIQTVNDYDRDVYNGDIGTVVSLHTEPCGGGGGGGGRGGGESSLRVHWVAVPKALRARRVNRCHRVGGAAEHRGIVTIVAGGAKVAGHVRDALAAVVKLQIVNM